MKYFISVDWEIQIVCLIWKWSMTEFKVLTFLGADAENIYR